MTPPQQVVLSRPLPSATTQKAQLTYKLFLLENARNRLEQELLSFVNKAYEEVQGFLRSSFPPSAFSDLAKALDAKREAVDKLSALLKDLTVGLDYHQHDTVCDFVIFAEPQVCVKNGFRANQLKPSGDKGIVMTDVLKFGPMLQNSLMASSIAKAVQVLGATLSLQQFKHFLISKPAAVQKDDMICSIGSSYNSATVAASSSSHLKAEKKDRAVVPEGKPDAAILPPAVIQSPEISAERPPPLLLPPIQAIFPEIRNPKPMKITPLISWGCEEDVQVQHQKQTSSQLLHFLQAKAKNMGALEVTVLEWSESALSVPRSMLPTVKTQSYQFRHVVTDDLIDARAPKTLSADLENQIPVFRVKRVESSGSLTYTCVIATKTELWDIGDIFTEVQQGDSEASPLGNKDCQNITGQAENSCVNIQWKTQSPEHEGNSADAQTSAMNCVTVPEFQIRRFEETEVVVSHVVSPSNFYIQHADCVAKLRALVTDSWKASSSYAEQNCIPDIGTQVMGWFPVQEQWFRAQVTKICGVSADNNGAGRRTSIKVEVKRLDHGDTACLSLWDIKHLTPELAILPLQAVQVSLANVTPVHGRDWSEEAVSWFQAMVHNRTLYARLYPQGPKVTVELFLEKGKLGAMRRGASLSLRLAQNGHANHSKVKNAGVMKRSTAQDKVRKQEPEWEKYLISCYTRRRNSESRECA
ncbi:KH domain-containing protein akap-1 [Nibea albiflora]|uniref:KH domain-containing protein akap-1 n=1 Tax=Nibea albiflora TaxID=240163 RepID=A0ACB7ER67_NIBAL|nr:KH domain-containing protein akap-1 [Nibea albiflora]